MVTQLPVRFDTATGPGQFGGLLVEIDPDTGQCQDIHRLFWRE
jgi:calcineurin-like phosphoesterase